MTQPDKESEMKTVAGIFLIWLCLTVLTTAILTSIGYFINWSLDTDWHIVRFVCAAVGAVYSIPAVAVLISEDEHDPS